jgi:Arc/MetJ-type ribon-helix-helix transcriptional regulator
MPGKDSANSYNGCMAQMNISIREMLRHRAEQRVAQRRSSSTSDYVRDLVRDQVNEEKLRHLETAIDEGLGSSENDSLRADFRSFRLVLIKVRPRNRNRVLRNLLR